MGWTAGTTVSAMSSTGEAPDKIAAVADRADVLQWRGKTAGEADARAEVVELLRAAGPGRDVALVRALGDLAAVRTELDQWDEAIVAADEAAALSRTLDPAVRVDALIYQMVVLRKAGRLESAAAVAAELIGLLRGSDAAAVPDGDGWLAVSLNDLASLSFNLGWHQQTAAPITEAIEIYRRLVDADPDRYRDGLGMACHNAATIFGEAGQLDRALDASGEGIRTGRRLVERDPVAGPPRLLEALLDHVTYLVRANRHAEGLPLGHEAVALARRLDARADLALALGLLFDMPADLGQDAEALGAVAEAVEVFRRLADPDAAAYSSAANNLGFALMAAGRHEESLAATAEAVAAGRRAAVGELALALWTFAEVRVAAGTELPEALAAIDESVALYRSADLPAEVAGAAAMKAEVETALASR